MLALTKTCSKPLDLGGDFLKAGSSEGSMEPRRVRAGMQTVIRTPDAGSRYVLLLHSRRITLSGLS